MPDKPAVQEAFAARAERLRQSFSRARFALREAVRCSEHLDPRIEEIGRHLDQRIAENNRCLEDLHRRLADFSEDSGLTPATGLDAIAWPPGKDEQRK